MSAIALVVSALALATSIFTAWLTLLRRGTVKMTQPTVIFFGPDGPKAARDKEMPKIFLRTLLFSTSKRGVIVENMYIMLQCEDISRDFDIWTYGDRERLVRGSGLFVGETGVEANHHFLISKQGEPFQFIAGQYRLSVYAHFLGDRNRKLLFSQQLEVSPTEADLIGEGDAGLYFDWSAHKGQYVPHLDHAPRSFLATDIEQA